MRRPCISSRACVALLASVLGLAQAASAADTIDHPIIIYVGGTAGGGIDLYARLVADHIGRHIPGNPVVNVQEMPGGGGIKLANDLAKIAPHDGTVMASFTDGPILEPLTGARNPGYGMNQFTWIGAVTRDFGVCIAWAQSPFKTIDDAKQQQMIVASTGAGAESDLWPKVINEVIGTKFKTVAGYPGSQEIFLAMENGEMQGRCGGTWSSLVTSKPDWLRDKKINVLLQIGLQKSSELPNVPSLLDLIDNPEDRQLIELLVGPSAMARALVAPPGLPDDKAALLRRAFDETMKDPEFLAEAAKIQADVAPTSGADVQQLVARIYATPQPVIDRAKKLLGH